MVIFPKMKESSKKPNAQNNRDSTEKTAIQTLATKDPFVDEYQN